MASFWPRVVAAFVTSRRVRGLLGTPGWGFGLASSSLVGQELGKRDEGKADAYAHDIIRYSMMVYGLLALGAFVLARPIASVFLSAPDLLTLAIAFIRVSAVSVLGTGPNRVSVGPLRASGDTR